MMTRQVRGIVAARAQRARVWPVIALVVLLAACGEDKAPKADSGPAVDPAFAAAQQAWRTQRQEDLVRPDGWTSLVGLHQLQLKAHYIGTDAGNGIRLAVGPGKLGMVTDGEGRIRFTPEPGVAITFNGEPAKGAIDVPDDRQPTPGLIGFDEGKGLLSVIERGGHHYLRLKHADAPARVNFSGLRYWPANPAWTVQARFVPHPPGKTLPIVDIISVTTETPNPGAVEFEHDGKRYRMEALGDASGGLFFVFADRTSGHGSYPAGRFLDTAAPVNGVVTLDFNQAYNPPCAFTPFATCPLPPPENRLDLAVTAGEQAYVPPKGKKS